MTDHVLSQYFLSPIFKHIMYKITHTSSKLTCIKLWSGARDVQFILKLSNIAFLSKTIKSY